MSCSLFYNDLLLLENVTCFPCKTVGQFYSNIAVCLDVKTPEIDSYFINNLFLRYIQDGKTVGSADLQGISLADIVTIRGDCECKTKMTLAISEDDIKKIGDIITHSPSTITCLEIRYGLGGFGRAEKWTFPAYLDTCPFRWDPKEYDWKIHFYKSLNGNENDPLLSLNEPVILTPEDRISEGIDAGSQSYQCFSVNGAQKQRLFPEIPFSSTSPLSFPYIINKKGIEKLTKAMKDLKLSLTTEKCSLSSRDEFILVRNKDNKVFSSNYILQKNIIDLKNTNPSKIDAIYNVSDMFISSNTRPRQKFDDFFVNDFGNIGITNRALLQILFELESWDPAEKGLQITNEDGSVKIKIPVDPSTYKCTLASKKYDCNLYQNWLQDSATSAAASKNKDCFNLCTSASSPDPTPGTTIKFSSPSFLGKQSLKPAAWMMAGLLIRHTLFKKQKRTLR